MQTWTCKSKNEGAGEHERVQTKDVWKTQRGGCVSVKKYKKCEHGGDTPNLKKTSMLVKGSLRLRHDSTRLLHHTHILDIIGGYGLVVAIYGTLGYDNNVQPFLIVAVLQGYRSKNIWTHTTGNVLHCQKLEPVMETEKPSCLLQQAPATLWKRFHIYSLV